MQAAQAWRVCDAGGVMTFSGNGSTAVSRKAINSANTNNTPMNEATPGHPALLHATPPADPSTLEPT